MAFAHTKNGESIDMPSRIADRLTQKQVERMRQMVEGIDECDWDVSKSSYPVVISRCFGFTTGRSDRVETPSNDHAGVFYARVDRGRQYAIWGRFIRGRRGQMSRHQTIILRPKGYGLGWYVVAAYIGSPAPPFPGDPFQTKESLPFWQRHALVDGALPRQEGAEMGDVNRPW